MGVGRFMCVALPFILSVASMIALLIACLGGVSNKDLYMFRVDLREMQISQDQIKGLVDGALDNLGLGDLKDIDVANLGDVDLDNLGDVDLDNLGDTVNEHLDNIDLPNLGGVGSRDLEERQSNNVTAKQLGLDRIYDVALWGYCETDSDKNRTCTDPTFNWAEKHLNTSWIEAVGTLSGGRIELPDEVTDALNTYKTVAKWTQVAYIISFVSLALSVICGIFANCTRVMSCVTFLVATVAEIAVVASAALSTVTSTVVIGTVESTAKLYGVRGNFNTTFLALVWISAACAIGAAFFWLFTICCCAPNHSSRDRKARNRDSTDNEKLLSGGSSAYQPLGTPQHQGFYNAQAGNQYGAPRYPAEGRADMAYEPYSHRG